MTRVPRAPRFPSLGVSVPSAPPPEPLTSEHLHPQAWLSAAEIEQQDPDGPALLLPEIAALVRDLRVWLPFHTSRELATERWIGRYVSGTVLSQCVNGDPDTLPTIGCAIDAVYFGIPTIVDDKPMLSPHAPDWNKGRARHAARVITERAIRAGATVIVSGLGSGDISPDERIADMGGGKIVAYKDFGSFQDWVIARWVE